MADYRSQYLKSGTRRVLFCRISCLCCVFAVLVLSCSNQYLVEEKVLLSIEDSKGRVVKTVVTGWIPGEDVFLTISHFDTIGRVIMQSGARPYGIKFKSSFRYDAQGRIIEEVDFQFSGGGQNFEYYKSKPELYSLSDTLVDYTGVESKTRTTYEYLDARGLIREVRYLIYDSLRSGENWQVVSDRIYRDSTKI